MITAQGQNVFRVFRVGSKFDVGGCVVGHTGIIGAGYRYCGSGNLLFCDLPRQSKTCIRPICPRVVFHIVTIVERCGNRIVAGVCHLHLGRGIGHIALAIGSSPIGGQLAVRVKRSIQLIIVALQGHNRIAGE